MEDVDAAKKVANATAAKNAKEVLKNVSLASNSSASFVRWATGYNKPDHVEKIWQDM
jgi:hypothetical protein